LGLKILLGEEGMKIMIDENSFLTKEKKDEKKGLN